MIYGEKVNAESIRWAMIGGGKGSNIGYIHRSAALRDNNFKLVAGAFDIDPEKGAAFGRELGVEEERCYANYKEMLDKEGSREDGIQAVSIATPNSTHYEITKACLEAGLHVICEKPLCFTYEEAVELESLSTEQGLILGVTYGYSGHQMVAQARKMVEEGQLGDIRLVNTEFAYGAFAAPIEELYPGAKWRMDPAKAGPSFILGDVGTHALHMAEIMVPGLKIKDLMCVKQHFGKGRKLEDNAHVLMKCENDIFVNLWASGINAGQLLGLRIRIIGSKASLEWYSEQPNQMRYEEEGQPVRILERGTPFLFDDAKETDRIGAGHPEGLFESWSNVYRRFATAIGASLRGDKEFMESFWYPNVHEGVEGVKFVEASVKSAEEGSVWIDYENYKK